MQDCRITIATSVDGARETSLSYKGFIHFKDIGVCSLQYIENQAKISMEIEENIVNIERVGDYTLRLKLKKGEVCDGMIGIGGANGDVKTKTHALEYKKSENSILLLLKYDLLIGTEIQRMKLRLHAKFYKAEENEN